MILWGVLHFCSSHVSVLSWFGPMAITAMTRRPEDQRCQDPTKHRISGCLMRLEETVQHPTKRWLIGLEYLECQSRDTGETSRPCCFFCVNEKPPRSRTILNPFCTHVIWTYFTVQNIAYVPYVPYVQAYQTQIKRCSLNCILRYIEILWMEEILHHPGMKTIENKWIKWDVFHPSTGDVFHQLTLL